MTDTGKMINAVKMAVESEIRSGVREFPSSAAGLTNAGELVKLKARSSDCERCDLCKSRTNLVFGEGAPDADIMFVGEAPGRDEDKQGRPFVGRAGKLLTDIIKAMGFDREEVYIANILKCRPPGNRNPEPQEIAQCMPILTEQINAISPKVICTLGKFASHTLLATEEPISRLRGEFREYGRVKVMPTYHPAYLLRNPKAKKDVWKDMKQVASFLGVRIPARGQKKK